LIWYGLSGRGSLWVRHGRRAVRAGVGNPSRRKRTGGEDSGNRDRARRPRQAAVSATAYAQVSGNRGEVTAVRGGRAPVLAREA